MPAKVFHITESACTNVQKELQQKINAWMKKHPNAIPVTAAQLYIPDDTGYGAILHTLYYRNRSESEKG